MFLDKLGFPGRIGLVDGPLKKINFTGVRKRPKGSGRPRSVRTSEFRETSNLWRRSSFCSHLSVLHVYKNQYEIFKKMDILQSFVRRIEKHDLWLKIYKRMSGLLSFDRWCHFILQSFYARKQLLLSARHSHRNSVCPSVRSSHRWISQKRCKLELPNLYRRLPGRL